MSFVRRACLGQIWQHTRTIFTKSAVTGPLDPSLSLKTLPAFFASEILAKHSTRPALICPQEKPGSHGGPVSRNLERTNHLAWDYEEFDSHIQALARGLLAIGVKKGDRVGIIMGNNSAYAMLQWATASIGAILVTLNPAYRLSDLLSTLNLSSVSHLFIVPSLRSSSYIEILSQALPEVHTQKPGSISTSKLPSLRNIVVVDNDSKLGSAGWRNLECAVDWRDILLWDESTDKGRQVREISEGLEKDDVVNLQFTSGTTGAPKAVSLTHSNLLNNGISIGSAMNFTSHDVLCNVPPLFHCFGLVLGNLAAQTHGACLIYPSASYDPPSIVDALVSQRCTALHGVPTHFLGVLGEVRKRRELGILEPTIEKGKGKGLSKLRTGIAAGSSVPIELMKKLVDEMGLTELTVAYGMTETSPVSFQSTPSDPLIKRVETVGKVRPHVRAKIVDPQGRIVDVGQPGEVVVAGYLLQKGYWNDEEHTKMVMRKDEEGTLWMYTGDEGVMDEEGYLRIVGRIKDIIIRGGENLFPVQIENVLTSHPLIREVAVVSVPDSKYGEVVGAWVVREPQKSQVENGSRNGGKLSREDVQKCVVGSGINTQNTPAWVWFVGEDGTPDELPKTASGKVMKHVLRAHSRKLSKRGIGKVGSKDI